MKSLIEKSSAKKKTNDGSEQQEFVVLETSKPFLIRLEEMSLMCEKFLQIDEKASS